MGLPDVDSVQPAGAVHTTGESAAGAIGMPACGSAPGIAACGFGGVMPACGFACAGGGDCAGGVVCVVPERFEPSWPQAASARTASRAADRACLTAPSAASYS